LNAFTEASRTPGTNNPSGEVSKQGRGDQVLFGAGALIQQLALLKGLGKGRQSAQKATADDIEVLNFLLKQLDDVDLAYAVALEIDFRFNRLLLDISGSFLMYNLMEVTYEFIVTQKVYTTPTQRETALASIA
jgi:hypothetical protein